MRIEDLRVTLRPRTIWEATDLGYRMTWEWRHPIFPLFLIILIPVAATTAVIFRGNLFWTAFVMWWLKPLWDRIPLFVLSRSVFGPPPTIRQALRQLPKFALPGLFLALTLKRLSPHRVVTAPLDCLEGGRASLRASRKKVIVRPIGGHLAGLWFWFAFLETFILGYGLIIMGAILIPEELVNWFILVPNEAAFFQIYGFTWMIGMLFLEPFYAGMGFAVYLNRRTILECWDIELTFRKLSNRLKPVAAILCFIILGLVANPNGYGQDPSSDEVASGPPRITDTMTPTQRKVAEALNDERMGSRPEGGYWRLRRGDDENTSTTRTFDGGALLPLLVRLAKWLLLLGLVFLIGYSIYRYWPRDPVTARSSRSKPRAREGPSVSGLPLEEEPLPDDILDAARMRWQQENPRAALSLLYRGALRVLTEKGNINLGEDATERECLQKVRGTAPKPIQDYFGHLTNTWIAAAYAERYPDFDRFESLCNDWRIVEGIG